ncbi:hypothetical protein BIW11_09814, partial [Tropilaelaps mercedesae]
LDQIYHIEKQIGRREVSVRLFFNEGASSIIGGHIRNQQ